MTITDDPTVLPELQTLTSVEDGCLQIGRYLGLNGPITRDAFIAIIDNPTYATELFTARGASVFRDHLLAHPQCRRQIRTGKTDATTAQKATVNELSNAALLAKAAHSFLVWGRGGFKTADDALFQQRMAACEACPHHTATPDKLAYKLAAALSGNANRKICGLCGCVTGKKARLRDERCPGPHPKRPGYSRWGDALRTGEQPEIME